MRRVRAVVRPVRFLVATALAAPLLALLAPTSAGAGTTVNYVSLGDSYTAGPLVPSQIWWPLSAIGCIRSDGNYPNLVATDLGLSLTDMSCSGAETPDMTSPQGVTPGPNPAQLSAVTSTTNVVSLEIGGNDIGFSDIITNCISWNPFAGDPCTQLYDPDGNDTLLANIEATAPKIAAVINDIHQLAPKAKVFVLGYPDILPLTGDGCWPSLPLSIGDLPYLRQTEENLNSMIESVAEANGADYVDVYTPSIGHDACTPEGTRWIEPLIPGQFATPVHPNATGMAGMAAALEGAMTKHGVR